VIVLRDEFDATGKVRRSLLIFEGTSYESIAGCSSSKRRARWTHDMRIFLGVDNQWQIRQARLVSS
jgi:hypothetical protein